MGQGSNPVLTPEPSLVTTTVFPSRPLSSQQLAPPNLSSAPLAPQLPPLPLITHLRWSKEWMLREDLPWPPPTQLRERPNMSAAPARRSPHGFMLHRPSGPAITAAAQAEATVEVILRSPTTFLPDPQPSTDIQPEPAVRPPRFTAVVKKNSGKCSSPRRLLATRLREWTTRPGMHHAAFPKRRGERRRGCRTTPWWAGS